ncbi:Ankyrin repeat family protein [Forsythia ovata]|uniref:Ankyrin repeat family protein n=1 Tax=Forsythia ovata TaxID=205694 RepID=A0ABD1W3Q0_9LAMI
MALRNERTATVKGLIRYDPNLIRVQGRVGITPLHYVVEMENIDLLIRFLLECPSSIKDLTVRFETAVHIAVRKRNITAFKVLFGWIQRTDNTAVLTWRDEEGNTLLHVAALTNQLEVMESLIKFVDVTAKNSEGKTPLDIRPLDLRSGNAKNFLMQASYYACSSVLAVFSVLEDTPSPCDYLRSRTKLSDMTIKFGAYLHLGLSGDMRNAFLVIVALVATATYQAALAPPSAFSNAQNTSVNVIFPNTTSVNANSYILSNNTNIDNKTQITEFTIVNTICFGMAMGTSFVLTLQPGSGDYSPDEAKYLIYSSKYASKRSQEEGAF